MVFYCGTTTTGSSLVHCKLQRSLQRFPRAARRDVRSGGHAAGGLYDVLEVSKAAITLDIACEEYNNSSFTLGTADAATSCRLTSCGR